MKIRYLGTAAAEGLPAVWCNCETCERAREAGGKNRRTRSQMLFGDSMLLDLPMDTYMHSLEFGLNLSKIENALITHAHMDHCYPSELMLHGSPYAHNLNSKNINIFGNSAVIAKINSSNGAEIRENVAETVILHEIKPYDTFNCGEYTVTALPAQHTKGEECLIYLIEQDGVSALVFNDSGILPMEVYEYLAKRRVKLNAVSFDCTYGYARHGAGRHMGALDNLDELEKMRQCDILAQNAKFIATHFSHNGAVPHEQMEKLLEKIGFITAYDGMEIIIT